MRFLSSELRGRAYHYQPHYNHLELPGMIFEIKFILRYYIYYASRVSLVKYGGWRMEDT